MAYFNDMKILVYVQRGVYTQSAVKRKEDDYMLLRFLLGTTYREFESSVMTLSPRARLDWHDEYFLLEVTMHNTRWDPKYAEVHRIKDALDQLEKEHGYAWETANADMDDHRRSYTACSRKVTVPLLRIKPTIEVNL
jgi:hypothetical protein